MADVNIPFISNNVGNIGIGTDNPMEMFHVAGVITASVITASLFKGNLDGTAYLAISASYASNSLSSSYSSVSINSIFASQSRWAVSASWASASFNSTTSSYTHKAQSAIFASQSFWAVSSSWSSASLTSTTSSYSNKAESSIFASQSRWSVSSSWSSASLTSITSSYTHKAQNSVFASQSFWVVSASWASSSLTSVTSSYSNEAESSVFSSQSFWAVSASFASSSLTASYVVSAVPIFTGKTDNYYPKWSSNTLTGTSLISDNGNDELTFRGPWRITSGSSDGLSTHPELFGSWESQYGGGWTRGIGWVSGSKTLAMIGGYGNASTGNFNYLYFGSGSSVFSNPWMVITNEGNVGIGTTNPQEKLHVFGQISASGFGSGSFHGTSSYANRSNIAVSSLFASQSLWAVSASWSSMSLNSVTSSYTHKAQSSVFASSSVSASYAHKSDNNVFSSQSFWAVSASFASSSSDLLRNTYNINVLFSSQSRWSTSASWASSSVSSSFATTAVNLFGTAYNISALFASQSRWAVSASFASRSISASYVDGATPIFTGKTDNYLPKWSSNTLTGTSLVYDDGTNVGIGTNNPLYSLTIRETDNSAILGLIVDDASARTPGVYLINNSSIEGTFRLEQSSELPHAVIIEAGEGGTTYTAIRASGSAVLQLVPGGGLVGIGTTTPQIDLDVVGAIRSTNNSPLPTSGIGMELFFQPAPPVGHLQTVDRSTSIHYPVKIGNTLTVSASLVGIANTQPSGILHVGNDLYLTSSVIIASQYSASDYGSTSQLAFRSGQFDRFLIETKQLSPSSHDYLLNFRSINSGVTDWNTVLTLKGINETVGISTTIPASKLHVFGHISASGFGSGSLRGTASYADRGTVSLTSFYASQSFWSLSASFSSGSVTSSFAQKAQSSIFASQSFWAVSASYASRSLSSSYAEDSLELNGQLANYYLNISSTHQTKSGNLTVGTDGLGIFSIGSLNSNHPFLFQAPLDVDNGYIRNHISNRWFWDGTSNTWSSSANVNTDFYGIAYGPSNLTFLFGALDIASKSLTTSSYAGYSVVRFDTFGITLTSGSLIGTSSWARNAITSNFATSASFASRSVSASWADSANPVFTGKTDSYYPKWSSNTLTATSLINDNGSELTFRGPWRITSGSTGLSTHPELFGSWESQYGGGWARGIGWVSGSRVLGMMGGYGNASTGDFNYIYFGSGSNIWTNPWMVITNGGNVGIGTTNPIFTLDIGGTVSGDESLRISAGSSGNNSASLFMGTNTREWRILVNNSAAEYRMDFDYIGSNPSPYDSVLCLSSNSNIGIRTNPTSLDGVTISGSVKLQGPVASAGGNLIYGTYASFGETYNGVSTILGNNILPHKTTGDTVYKFASNADSGSYISVHYQRGIQFYTGITGSVNTDIPSLNNAFHVMTVHHRGYVGIGTTNPGTILTIFDPFNGGIGSTPTASVVQSGLVIGGVGTGASLNMGVETVGALHAWIQSRNRTSLNYYNLALNPYGGNVGVGTTNATYLLDVSGSIRQSPDNTPLIIGTTKAIKLFNYNTYAGAGGQLWINPLNNLDVVSLCLGTNFSYANSVELTYNTSSGRFQIGSQGSTNGIHKGIHFYVNNSEKVTITGSQVGIMTATVASGVVLTVASSSRITEGASSTGILQFGINDSIVGYSASLFNIRTYVAGTEYYEALRSVGSTRYTLLAPATGSVGIGTASPICKFNVEANSIGWSALIRNNNNASTVYMSNGSGNGVYIDSGNNADSSTYALNVNKGGSVFFYVRGDGYIGINASPSTTGQVYINSINTSTAHLSLASGVTNNNVSNTYTFRGWWGIYFNSPVFNGGTTGLYYIQIYS